MKKNIDIISIDTPLLEWAADTLNKSPGKPSGASELIMGLYDLIENADSSLVIEQGTNEHNTENSRKICCGDLTIWTASRKVTRNDKEIALTPKEFDILYFLAKNRGEVFTKEQIYQAVWDGEYLLDDSNIMAFIRKIRKKIEPDPDSPRYILTLWGIGYKFSEEI